MGNSIPTFGNTSIPLAVPNTSQVVIPQITLQQPNYGQDARIVPAGVYETVGPQLAKVHGMDGAKQFPTVPNAVYALFDDEETIMFFKATDKNNYPILLKRFRYTEEEEAVPEVPEYVTKQEYSALLDEIKSLREEISHGKQHLQNAAGNGNAQSGAGKQSERR